MANTKYYNDIKAFPDQFAKGFEISDAKRFEFRDIKNIVLCGMGGSALYGDLLNHFLSEVESNVRINVSSSYNIPKNTDSSTLFIAASYSGNTEETILCAQDIKSKNLNLVILAAGGKLLEFAEENDIPFYQIPLGLQPRLSTGYFIGIISGILEQLGLVDSQLREKIVEASKLITQSLDEDLAKRIAKELVNKVPIVYATDNNWGIARVSKIKFNENAKTQSFWNYFPEMNHNEMIGYTNMLMDVSFLIFESQYTHPRNKKRIEIFSKLMKNQNLPVEIIKMKGKNNIEEILNVYFFIDHVTYYLALEYGIDPEPVDMVEEFKKLMN